MKIETADCVQAIVKYFTDKDVDDNSPLLDLKQWKRISKTGSGDSIKRIFKNKIIGDIIYVISSETEIFSVSETDSQPQSRVKKFDDFINEFKDFPYVKDFEFATIYSKDEIHIKRPDDFEDWVGDLEKFILSKDTRIGTVDPWSNEMNTLIIVKKDMTCYSNNSEMTSDGMLLFEVDDKILFSPAEEPVDMIEDDDYCSSGGVELENKDELKKLAKKYKLDHFLIGA